jgi:hypothetical protein
LDYLTLSALNTMVSGQFTGISGDEFDGGKLDYYPITTVATVLLGELTVFDNTNIDF